MLSLGLSGGFDAIHEHEQVLPRRIAHDSAVALVEDGQVRFALEEERLNRVKHTNRFPVQALRACLDECDVRLSDIGRILFYVTENDVDRVLRAQYSSRPPELATVTARGKLAELLLRASGEPPDPDRLYFVHHHEAHAASAHACSGFAESLCVVLDGAADGLCGLVVAAREQGMEVLARYPSRISLGRFYRSVCEGIGFGLFEEYKVMGLAPYGDPATHLGDFSAMYELLPHGQYALDFERVSGFVRQLKQRQRRDPIEATHCDVAAALQQALEAIALHVIDYHRATTGLRHLSLAGGVIQNCTLNGRILARGQFDDVFVQPAAYDAGCALGAALIGAPAPAAKRRIDHVFWGAALEPDAEIERVLDAWRPLVSFSRPAQLEECVADRLAAGQVVGWVQGRSEFGPRALGHRSILADPRPSSNRDRVNAMVKKREAFRPFAPAVLEEKLAEIFEVPAGTRELPFMSFTAQVCESYRSVLGATTHVDGSARVQSVSARVNPRFHALLRAFEQRTGVGVLLNTSFNNDAEPIVQSANDAVTCFLTTGLDSLALGDWILEKPPDGPLRSLGSLSLALPPHVRRVRSELRSTVDPDLATSVSEPMADLLGGARPGVRLDALAREGALAALSGELEQLWSRRWIRLLPAALEARS